MKKTILFVFAILFFLCAKAQKQDTTIYNGCHLANDTTQYIDGVDVNVLDACPQFKNGSNYLYKYILAHIRYPINARKNHIEGRVFISIIIEKDGNISHSKVERDVSKDIDKEALRVINSLPKWKPGILHGKPVRVRYTVIVPFKLSPKKSQ